MNSRLIKYITVLVLAAAALIASGAGERSWPEEPITVRYPLEHCFANPAHYALRDSAANVIYDPQGTLIDFLFRLWSLREGEQETVSVLHIGDSHVQAGFLTGRLRELFQSDFGDAGRGLISPYKLAGMNEPRDYSITVPYRHTSSKATDRESSRAGLGFNGVSVKFETPAQQFKIWSKSKFSGVTVLHGEGAPMLFQTDSLDTGIYCVQDENTTSSRIVLPYPVDSLLLKGWTDQDHDNPVFHGFALDNGSPGVLYHEAGVNGAAFEHFANNTTLLTGGAAPLDPDVIIVSLGTNNCYGNNFREEHLRGVVDRFFKALSEAYPRVAVLVITPMESCRRRNRAYEPNRNIAAAARVISEVAEDSGLAWWDMYSAAGGAGSNARWYKEKLFNTDRIHLTEAGYKLQADMLYEAFIDYYNRLTD